MCTAAAKGTVMKRVCWLGLAVLGCTPQSDGDLGNAFGTGMGPGGSTAVSGTGSASVTAGMSGAVTSTSQGQGSSGTDSASGPMFDFAPFPDVPSVDICTASDDMAGEVVACTDTAPPDAFEPEVQWGWEGTNGDTQSIVIPLVANLTDDNGDGMIDLCDTPDIVVAAFSVYGVWMGHLYALDGETGALHWGTDFEIFAYATPALGDIDGDGMVEIITMNAERQLVAVEHDGTYKWTSTALPWDGEFVGAIAIANVDNEGPPEIIAGNKVFSNTGELLATVGVVSAYSAPVPIDLDGDGDLEILTGDAAYHHDGTVLWETGLPIGFPQVADLDDDGLPEVLLTNSGGLNLIEHDGTVTYSELRPTGDPGNFLTWRRPATIHDFDGDGLAEYATSSQNNYSVFEANGDIIWSSTVLDNTGIAAGTAFDFLGDGLADAIFGDEQTLRVYDSTGQTIMAVPRSSGTIIEYPVVADVDNDGSAEIVVTSNAISGIPTAPLVQVVRDVDDRWIQARRIWNQHTYHVTNVREDGTIPELESPHWEGLNTFRTNAQIESGGICSPPAG